MKVKVVALSEVRQEAGNGKELIKKEQQVVVVTNKGKEEALVKVLSGQSGVGKEGSDGESEEMSDVRVEPVPRSVLLSCRYRGQETTGLVGI
jgi:hypothetical protein